MTLRRGLYGICIVLSIAWVGYLGQIVHDYFHLKDDLRVLNGDESSLTADEAYVKYVCTRFHIRHGADIESCLTDPKDAIKYHAKAELAGAGAAAIGVPFVLLIAGYIAAWVVRGVRRRAAL